jgi:hypothetical protein
MPIASLSSSEAAQNLRRNARGLWPDGRRRGQRLEGVADIGCQPSFSFSKEDQIMTIGSCFAREVESALAGLGFTLPTLSLEMPSDERTSEIPNDILNKYTVESMANEIEWAFAPPAIANTDLFVTAGEGLWHDPHLVHNVRPASLERVAKRREAVLRTMGQLPNCRIVVVTLGLAEAWYDIKLGFHLNSMPPQPALLAEPERFRLDVLSYEDIFNGIERLLGLLKQYGHPDHKVLMTVSPVPFKATFSGQDAIAANSYSKSVQRAAVEAAVRLHPHVNYFPSYEIVTLTDRKVAFKLDNIHVNQDVIAEIMRRVVTAYVPGQKVSKAKVAADPEQSREEQSLPGVLSRGHAALERGNHVAAVSEFSSILYRFGERLTPAERNGVFSGLVRAMVLAGRLKEAYQHCLRWQEADPESALAAATMSKVLEKLKKPQRAIEMATRACELQPGDPGVIMRLAALLTRCDRPDEAVEAARRALDLDPTVEAAREMVAKASVDPRGAPYKAAGNEAVTGTAG